MANTFVFPRTEVYATGQHVRLCNPGSSRNMVGRVSDTPKRDRNAAETNHIWIEWADGVNGYEHPNNLRPVP